MSDARPAALGRDCVSFAVLNRLLGFLTLGTRYALCVGRCQAGVARTPKRGLVGRRPGMSSCGWRSGIGEKCLMLVLSRKLQQQIRIDDRITVTILKTRGQTVRVGIEAPRDVRVVRGELAPTAKCPQSRRAGCPATARPGAASLALERSQHAAPHRLRLRKPERRGGGERGSKSSVAVVRRPDLQPA